ncbi:hypothetical protein [Actinospica robiniae]|uniref:hypothetical protein n=1 Tax=Actinospica robiniae TaxID=304901 RepID=UPI000416B844|nr:hypothetical protein [Actinospica robiniae]
MDVDNIDALNPAELEAVLERALDPRVPVELLYAVLERLGRLDQAAAAHEGAAELPAPAEAYPPAAPVPAAAAITAYLPVVPAQGPAPLPAGAEPGPGESED